MLHHEIGGARQILRRRHVRHGRAVVITGLGLVERGAHHEHGRAVLDRRHAPCREAAAVAHALDVVDDGVGGVAAEQKVGVQRMDGARRVDRAHGGDQRLAEHLPAVDALPAVSRAHAAIEVLLELLEIENGDEARDGPGRFKVGRRHGWTWVCWK